MINIAHKPTAITTTLTIHVVFWPSVTVTDSSGKVISADRINNDLNNATYNIGAITAKLEAVLTKLAQVNHYVASNNFKKDKLD